MPGRGIFTGRVLTSYGTYARGASVYITRILADNGQWGLAPRQPEGKTDSHGRFSIEFAWNGYDFAEGLFLTVYYVAMMEKTTTAGLVTTYSSEGTVHGSCPIYLFPNVTFGPGAALPDLSAVQSNKQGAQTLLQFSLDIMWSLQKVKAALPNVHFDHAERLTLLGAQQIFLKD